jgi:hypothetical protein
MSTGSRGSWAACDVAVVQGGLTTSLELAAARRPFLYFPLRRHFEQNLHVRHRLERYGAGRAMDYATATPETIAHELAAATVATRWFESRRGLVTGVLTASNASGQMIFLPALAWIATVYGWRYAAVTVAASRC